MSLETSADRRVRLFPLSITRTQFKFKVAALGAQRSVMLTADEALAVKYLVKERAVGKAWARLRRFQPGTEVAEGELIDKLVAARLVHELDGQVIEPAYAGQAALALARLRRYVIASPAAIGNLCEKAGSRLLPIDTMLWINRGILHALFPKRRRMAILARVRQHMASVLVYRSRADVEAHAGQFLRGYLRTLAELVILHAAPVPRVRDWVLRVVRTRDTAALTEALAQGRGAIVFHYHMGPIHYVPALLSALGFKVTLLGMSIARPRDSETPFSIVDDLRPAGVMKLLRALQRGEVVVLAPDQDIRRIDHENAHGGERLKLFAGAWKKRSRMPVTFLGQEVWTYTGLAWLHEQSVAPLICASVTRDDDGTVHFRCEPFEVTPSPRSQAGEPAPTGGAALSRREWTQRTMSLVYRRYEEELLSHPEQWALWMSFFKDHAAATATPAATR